MTGVYRPRKNPDDSLFLITDSRPLLTRGVSSFTHTLEGDDRLIPIPLDATRHMVLLFYDLRRLYPSAHL